MFCIVQSEDILSKFSNYILMDWNEHKCERSWRNIVALFAMDNYFEGWPNIKEYAWALSSKS